MAPLHKICVWKIKRKLSFNQSESRIKGLRLIFLICDQTGFISFCGVLMIEIINLIDFSVLRLRNKTDSTWKQYNLFYSVSQQKKMKQIFEWK